MIELTIKLKTSERTQIHKHVLYDTITLSHEDKILAALVEEAKVKFGEEPDEISIRSLYFW